MESSRRVLLSSHPFPTDRTREWNRRGEWPARWITCEGAGQHPLVTAYSLRFALDAPLTTLLHVTADERYRLFIDGERVGEGSERGDVAHWFFETYEVRLPAGEHTIVAQVWSLGPDSPFAQFSLRHGFLLCPDDPDQLARLATGVAGWQTGPMAGYRFSNPQCAWGTGYNVTVSGQAFPWGFENDLSEGWAPAKVLDFAVGPDGVNDKSPRHLLIPATLPPMFNAPWLKARVKHVSFPGPGSTAKVPFRPEENLSEEVMDWTRLVIGNSLTVPPHSRRRVLLDLHDYVCAYPELTVSKGRHSEVRIHWQEALFDEYQRPDKGDRDVFENKYFCTIDGWDDGVGDSFLPDGGEHRKFTPLWWQAGRFVELLIRTEEQELILENLQFRQDHYPFERELQFQSSDPRLEGVGDLTFRTLLMCAHETYMDCPFYEQLQYIGDTRLQVLVSYLISGDDRLPRKALRMFDWSRQISGITESRYPSRVLQIIPPFSLWWIGMIWDFALWKGDPSLVAELLPGARIVLDWFRGYRNAQGLIEAPKGWNFVDWVPGWHSGMPLGADAGVSSIVNRQFEIALRQMAELEEWVGEPEMAQRHRRNASEIAEAVHRLFWHNKRGIYADDAAHTSFSEHAQVLSILTGALPNRVRLMVMQGLLSQKDLHRTTVYFSHYLFECYAQIGRTDLILSRMSLWFDHLNAGMKTIMEHPEPTRSDCHAWGAHPLYHYVASLLGIRPAKIGCRELVFRPQLAGLSFAQTSFPYAGGKVEAKVSSDREGLEICASLPEGVTANFVHGLNTVSLNPGPNVFNLR